jgi:hypothetical protein
MEKRCQWSYWYPTRLVRKSSGGIYKPIIDTIPVVAEKASYLDDRIEGVLLAHARIFFMSQSNQVRHRTWVPQRVNYAVASETLLPRAQKPIKIQISKYF